MGNPVKALILVGGQGTRLRPLTCNTPKSMVPVLNMPFLEHVVRNLKAHRITDIIFAQHHLAKPMSDYFGDGSKLGVNLTYVMEDSPRGTAGAVKNAERYLDSTFFVLNGDIFHNRDFTDFLKEHRKNRAKATIVLSPVEDPSIYGVVETDKAGRVLRFIEKPKREEAPSNWINAGTYVIEPDVLARIPPGIKYSFERELFPAMLDDGLPVYAYRAKNYWMDTGTPEKYLQLHRDLLAGKCDGYEFDRDLIMGDNCRIHPTAKMTGRIMMGDGCAIEPGVVLTGPLVMGARCRVGRGVAVAHSVLWDRVTVGPRATVRGCAIANDCTIGAEAELKDAVLGDHIFIEPGRKPEPGTRFFPEGAEGAP